MQKRVVQQIVLLYKTYNTLSLTEDHLRSITLPVKQV